MAKRFANGGTDPTGPDHEETLLRARAYRAVHADRINQQKREWRGRNRERVRLYDKRYRAKTRDWGDGRGLELMVKAAVPVSLPFEIREDVEQELAIEVWLGKLGANEISEAVGKIARDVYRSQTSYAAISIDAPRLGADGEHAPLRDLIAYPD